MESIALIIGIGTGIVSLATAGFGVLAFMRASARKEYASERDIGHLKRNQEQMTQNMGELWRQQDERFDSIDRQLDRLETHILGKAGDRPPRGHQLGK
jgi:hypothetical protein